MTMHMMTVVFIFALSLIGKYFIFEKMGMPGWKSLIPIYSDYLLFRELIGSGYFWGYIASALLAGSCSACTVTIAIQIKLAHSLSKSFGHGIGYTFGLIFIEPIMLMILGLGNNRYARAAA